MSALDVIARRGQLAAGFVAPRSGDVTMAAAGLERMRRLVDALANPQRAITTIHVAGSKGKGSTVAYAAAILTATGRKTGRYTSPHLMDWRERIAVDGVDISVEDFDRVLGYVDSIMTRLEAERPDETPHNAFELLTAAAFVHFQEVGCDAAVIEVGIGGRFDSTNVIDSDVSVITSIEAEHLDILGPTLADVAWNKAGIMRGGIPCVVVAQRSDALEVIQREAFSVAADLILEGRDWSVSGTADRFTVQTPVATFPDLAIPNPMAPQLVNAAAAVVATVLSTSPKRREIRGNEIRVGLDARGLPGRFEVFEGRPTVVLDVAHTADSLAALGEGVCVRCPGRHVVVLIGVLDDKDIAGVVTAIAAWADDIVATTAPSPRARSSDEIAEAARSLGALVTDVSSVDLAWRHAIDDAGADGVVVVTGSFALVSHIRRLLLTST